MLQVNVFEYNSGDRLGSAEIDWDSYESGWNDDDTQVIRAGDVLSAEDCERLGIPESRTVWCEKC